MLDYRDKIIGEFPEPEDRTLCNNAEGCDDCKWNVVCFEEGQ